MAENKGYQNDASDGYETIGDTGPRHRTVAQNGTGTDDTVVIETLHMKKSVGLISGISLIVGTIIDIHSECRISKYMLQIQKITGPLSLDQLESLKNLSEIQEIKISTANNYRDIREMSQNSRSRRTKAQEMWMMSPRKLKINYFESGNTKTFGEHGTWSRQSDCMYGTYTEPKVDTWQERRRYERRNKENEELQAETDRSMNSHRQTTYAKTKDTNNDNLDTKMASVIEETLDHCKKRLLERCLEVRKGTATPTSYDLYTQCEENPIYYSYDYLSPRKGRHHANYSHEDSGGYAPYCNDILRNGMEIPKTKLEPCSSKLNEENIVLTPPSIPSSFSYYTTASAIPKDWTVEESDNDVLDDHYYRQNLVVPRLNLEFRENPKKEKAPEGKLSHHSSYSSFWSKSETSNSVRNWLKEKGIDFNELSSRPEQEQNITSQTVDDTQGRTLKEVNQRILQTRQNLTMDYELDSSSSDESLYSNPSARILAKTQSNRTDNWVLDTSDFIEMAKLTGAEQDLFPQSEPGKEDNMSESDSSVMSDWPSISQRNSHRNSPKLETVEAKTTEQSTFAMQQMTSEEPAEIYIQRLPLSPIEEISDEFSEKSNQVGQVEIHREWSEISIFSREGKKDFDIGSTDAGLSKVKTKSFCHNDEIDNEWSDVSVFSREEKPANLQRLKECYMEECLEEEKKRQKEIRDDWSDVSVFSREGEPHYIQRMKEVEKQRQNESGDDWSDISVFSRNGEKDKASQTKESDKKSPADEKDKIKTLEEYYKEYLEEKYNQGLVVSQDNWSDISVFSRNEGKAKTLKEYCNEFPAEEKYNQRQTLIQDDWSDISVFSRAEEKGKITEEYKQEYQEGKQSQMQSSNQDDWSDVSVLSRTEKKSKTHEAYTEYHEEKYNQMQSSNQDDWSDISVFSQTEKKAKTHEEYYREYKEEKRVEMQTPKQDDWSDISVFSREGQQDGHPEMNDHSCTIDISTKQNMKVQQTQMKHAESMGYYSSDDSEIYTGVSGYVNNIVKTLERQNSRKQMSTEEAYSTEGSDIDSSELSFKSPGSGVVILSELASEESETKYKDYKGKGNKTSTTSNLDLDASNVETKKQDDILPGVDHGCDDTDAESIISWSDDALPDDDFTQFEENRTGFSITREQGKTKEDSKSEDKDSFWGSDEDEFREIKENEISRVNASHLKRSQAYEQLKKSDNRLSVDEVTSSSDWNSDDSTESDDKSSEKNVNHNCRKPKNKAKRDKSSVSKARVSLSKNKPKNEAKREKSTVSKVRVSFCENNFKETNKELLNTGSNITSVSSVGQESSPIQTLQFKPNYDMQTLSLLACAGCSIRDLMGSSDTKSKPSIVHESRPSYSEVKTINNTSNLTPDLRQWEPLNLVDKSRTTSFAAESDGARYSEFNRAKTSDWQGSSGMVNGSLYPKFEPLNLVDKPRTISYTPVSDATQYSEFNKAKISDWSGSSGLGSKFGMASQLTPFSYSRKWSAS